MYSLNVCIFIGGRRCISGHDISYTNYYYGDFCTFCIIDSGVHNSLGRFSFLRVRLTSRRALVK